MAAVEKGLAKNTIEAYGRDLAKFVAYLESQRITSWSEVDSMRIRAFIISLRAAGLGVYAENDARIDAGLSDIEAAVRTYHKKYRYDVYPGVGHGFLRTREKPEVADSAWKAVTAFFRATLEH